MLEKQPWTQLLLVPRGTDDGLMVFTSYSTWNDVDIFIAPNKAPRPAEVDDFAPTP